jgi:hypothetical protein
MSRVFISGSTTGLGLMAGELLASQSHRVVLHARNADRAEDARRALPKAEAVLVGDVETIAGAKDVASQANALGRFDALIHNAAVGYREGHRVTSDGLPHVFAINTLSAYILTALVARPKRLVYLSSGTPTPTSTTSSGKSVAGTAPRPMPRASSMMRYSPSPLPSVAGWVATKLGGSGAPDDINQAHLTQVWLAAGDDPKADVTGQYFYHLRRMEPNAQAQDPGLQDRLIAICSEISGVPLPA